MKNNGRHNINKQKINKKYLIIFLIIISVLMVLFFLYYHLTKRTENSLSSILEKIEDNSKFEIKNFKDAEYLNLSNLDLVFENNITVISFNINNTSSVNQNIFNFTFSLLDENGNILVDFDLSSKEIIEGNNSRKFTLVVAKDVSNAVDYTISLNK